MNWLKSPFFWFLLAVLTTAGLTAIGPEEKTLGENVRIVYLHGAWVLTAEAALALAGFFGLLGILFRRERLHRWSAALGRTGIVFWVIYLPLSLWAMQANWNGLFLSEPRFRIAFIFAVTGVLLQMGLAFLARPVFTSLANVLFFAALWITLRQADYVLHPPPSPIFSSGILSLQLFFVGVIFLTMAAAYFLTRWWLQKQS
ncbi:MAG: hypothetical protein HY781_10855 [Chloroflexi bacterium]|nr:hypothetical protein [Chloroflexota bacterium]